MNGLTLENVPESTNDGLHEDSGGNADRVAALHGAVISERVQKLEKEKRQLIAALDGGDFSSQRTRVAFVLNLYPLTRNSDVALTLKYWEIFQPDIYNEHGIKPEDLFKLERIPVIVRARAKIQNEYELFQADGKVRAKRRDRESEVREAVLKDAPPIQTVQVFSDEAGKTDSFLIVGSVWALNGRAVYTVDRAINEWKSTSNFSNKEVHFSRFGKGDFDSIDKYLDIIQSHREFLSFKAIAISRINLKRSTEQAVQRLHELMLIEGIKHEIDSGRIGLPRRVSVTLDEEQSLDRFTLRDMKERLRGELASKYGEDITLERVASISSRNSSFVQISDVIAGAVNRRLNFSGERNHKDEIADLIIRRLGLDFDREKTDLDAAVMLKV
ncbi:hypothetical protein PIGHUM_04600 [Pigmentiphaga humi]|uniref:DUF3800 domain-containing protein n=1 Tax=Pigmentiphaga humi TaxID=2478468 RepID=A0A3P4BA51_9BURK|nr:DUF3800 domain-containing protein [Pigmentiphaga humi]VCU72500.1 hypothetical protein PIGHUM_04600 [Pigmentiphaga humi]